MIAAMGGQTDMLKLLVEHAETTNPAPPNHKYPNAAAYHLGRFKESNGWHCLFYAAMAETDKSVRYLVDELHAFSFSPDVSLDRAKDGDTVLDVAADDQKVDTLKYLIEKSGRNVNQPLVRDRQVRYSIYVCKYILSLSLSLSLYQ